MIGHQSAPCVTPCSLLFPYYLHWAVASPRPGPRGACRAVGVKLTETAEVLKLDGGFRAPDQWARVLFIHDSDSPHADMRGCTCPRSLSSFDDKISGLRAAAADEASHVARKLVDSLESASDIDLSELRISRRSLIPADGCYPPYGGYGPIYPPSYPCPPPPAATSPPPAAPPPPGER